MLKRLVAVKVYFDRARVYIGYGQTLMIVVIFIDAVGWKPSRLMYAILFLLFFVIAVFVGWLDTRLKIRKMEYENQSMENPVTTEILKVVGEINKKT